LPNLHPLKQGILAEPSAGFIDRRSGEGGAGNQTASRLGKVFMSIFETRLAPGAGSLHESALRLAVTPLLFAGTEIARPVAPQPSADAVLVDSFARRFGYLRLSITDVCNFRCSYCLPNGYKPDGSRDFLSRSELLRVARSFVAMGTRKIRLTGGEPSMRRELDAILGDLRGLPGLDKLVMTTNGYRLKERAAQWRAAGLDSLNVSIDSLDPRQFRLITGENRLGEILAGLEAAWAAGFGTIKVNTVLLKGLNHHEFNDFLCWVKDQPIQLRFIELMQTGVAGDYFARHHLRGAELEQQLLRQGWQLKARATEDGPARVYQHADYVGEVGLIMPYGAGFCDSCNRLRVSALGQLHLCLFGDGGIELRDLLGSDDPRLQQQLQLRLQQALQFKAKAHHLHEGDPGIRAHLASIGG
jgi:GTP 3',8-cyclase